MGKASPALTAFNAGELSQTLDGRVDLAKYANGCKRLENFLITIQGPAVRRGGGVLVGAGKIPANRVYLVRFEFSSTDALVLEFGDQYVKFYKNDHSTPQSSEPIIINPLSLAGWSAVVNYVPGDLVNLLGVAYYCKLAHINQTPPNATYWFPLSGTYEIPSPYLQADLALADGTFALSVEQSGDVLYICNKKRTYAPMKLTRFSLTNWVFSDLRPNQGPLIEQNNSTTTLQVSAVTGSVTVTASSAVFVTTDIGRLIRIDVQNLDTRPWQTNVAYALNDLVRSDGKTYKALNAATSGTSTPVHEHGNAYDGKTGVQWAYQDSGYGMARITAYTSATQVTASVIVDEPNGLAQFPVELVTVASKRWQLGAWSSTTEFPASVAFWNSRLWFAGKQRVWASVPNDFENMAGDFFGETLTDNAIWEQLQSQDVNDILWLAGADKLVIGTAGGQFVGDKITTTDPLGPGNFEMLRQGKERVRSVQPIPVGSSLLMVQRSGRKLMSLNYAVEIDKYAATDLAVLANRIARGGIIAAVYQSEPHSVLWCVLNNGKLLGFTYDRDQDVTGWHQHPMGGNGFVESVACIPSSDGTRDELWLSVRRTRNGGTFRDIEVMFPIWEGPAEDGTGSDVQAEAHYVDCGYIRRNVIPTALLTSLAALRNQTVSILADGAVVPDMVVNDFGVLTLPSPATTVHVGLAFTSRLVTMRIEAGGDTGTAQGKIKRVNGVTVRFLDTLGGKVGKYNGQLDSVSSRNPATPMGQPPQIFSGDVVIDFPGDYDTDGIIEVRQDQPLPMTVSAIFPKMKAYDA